MGTSLPLSKQVSDKVFGVLVPSRGENGELVLKEGYVRASEVNAGYIPYTARNVFNRAFELLNFPYGWGGAGGEQDCSGFLKQVFGVFGIELPKNSLAQSKIGELLDISDRLSDDEKAAVLEKEGAPGITTLFFRGHIMLYLGSYEGKPYAIHALWAYYEKTDSSVDEKRIVNRTVVSDLSLGEGTGRDSFLRRLSKAAVIK